MAATKLLFINQPNSSTAGATLVGSSASSVNLDANAGIQVGVYDANNVLQTSDTSSVTIAKSAGNGTLTGTLTQPVINGYATFNDLAVNTTAGGTNYTLQATDGGLTAATSNTFSQNVVQRVNPDTVTGAPSAIGVANAIGPYKYRGSRSAAAVRVSFVSNNTTDVAQIVFTEPGVALSANTAEVPKLTNYSGSITAPASIVLDAAEMGADVDIYVYTTTQTGTPTVKIQRVETHGPM